MLKSHRAFSRGPGQGIRGPQASFSGRTRGQADHLVVSSKGPAMPVRAEALEEAEDESLSLTLATQPALTPTERIKRVLVKAKSSLPADFLSLLRERPKYFAEAKARLRIGPNGRVLEVELVSAGPLHDRRYRAVRRFFKGLRFSSRPQKGDIWVEFLLDAPYLK